MLDGGGGGGGASSEAIGLFGYAEEDKLAASPASISSLADSIQGSAGNLEVLDPNLDKTYRPVLDGGTADLLHEVASRAPKPTKDNITEVLAASLCAAGATRLFGRDGVKAYNDLIDGLRSEYDSEKAKIMASNCGVEDPTYPKDATQAEKDTIDEGHQDDVDAARESAVSALVTRLRKKQKGYKDDPLDAEAKKTKTTLNKGPTEEVMQALYSSGGLPLSTVEALPSFHLKDVPLNEWPPELADATDEEKAQWLLEHPELGSVLAMNASENVQRIVGEKVADEVEKLNRDSSNEEVKRITELLKTWQDSSLGVTSEIYKALGPEKAVDIIDQLGSSLNNGELNPEDVKTFASTFKRGLELADGMWDDQEAYDYGQGLVKALDGGELGNHRPTALSYLLHDGNYSTGLLGGVGEELDHYERETNHGTSGLWSGRGTGTLVQLFPEDDRGSYMYSDPMTSYFTSLENNPEAALNFFAGGDGNRAYDEDAGFDWKEARERQEYYFKERVYGDNFESLFGSLEQATTGDINLDSPERQRLAAGVVSSMFEYVTDREGLESGDDYLQVSDEATVSLAHIVSGYMDSVSHNLANPVDGADRKWGDDGSIPVLGGDDGFMATFSTDELKNLVKLTVSTDDGTNALRYGVSAYENLALHRDIDANGELTKAALMNDARVEGFFVNCIGEQYVDEAEEADKRRAAWIGMGKDLVGAIPLPGADAVGVAGEAAIKAMVSASSGAAANGFTDALTQNQDAAEAERHASADEAFKERQVVIATMAYDEDAKGDSHLISDSELRAEAEKEAANFPDEDIVTKWFGTEDNPKLPSDAEVEAMSPTEREAYENVLKGALAANNGSFKDGSYRNEYITEFNRER